MEQVAVSCSVPEVLSRIRKHQDEVRDIMRDRYVEFVPNEKDYRMLMDSAKPLEVDITEVVNAMNQLGVTKSCAAWKDVSQYQRDVQEGVRCYKNAKKLLSIHDLFEALEGNAYEKRAHKLAKIKRLLDDIEDPVLPDLHCYHSLIRRYEIAYSELIEELNTNFSQLVMLQQRTSKNTKSVTIKICKDETQLCQVVVALLKTQHNFHSVCRFLLDEVLVPVITKPVSLICDEKSSDEHVQIQLSYQQKAGEELQRPGCKTVLSNLMQIIYHLSNMNAKLSEDECLFQVLARQMKKELCDLLIEQCLKRDTPGTLEGTTDSPMVKDVSDFNEFLTKCNFIDGENDTRLEEYASSVESIQHKKLCDSVLESALDIMRRESHDMVAIEQHQYQFASSTSTVAGQSLSCMITRTAVELKKFLDEVVTKVQAQHGEAADRLVKTIATILERYMVDVPMANEKLLFKMPQKSALFRNDCTYLNYWLQKNDVMLKDHCSFACISESLKTCGEDIFQHQLSSQRTQTMQALKGFELTNDLDELGSEHQRAIRQCIRQFELLKNAWQTVLPDAVYKQSVSGLVDVFLREVIKRVQSLEDITTAIGHGLVLLIDIMKETLPKLFKEPSEVHQLVKQWPKLMQLRQMLCASPVEISELWAEGKGPLTKCFSAEEVKQLVLAMFRNTNQRQACIASIV